MPKVNSILRMSSVAALTALAVVITNYTYAAIGATCDTYNEQCKNMLEVELSTAADSLASGETELLSTKAKINEVVQSIAGSFLTDRGTYIPGYHCPVASDSASELDDSNCKPWSGSSPDIGPFEKETLANEFIALAEEPEVTLGVSDATIVAAREAEEEIVVAAIIEEEPAVVAEIVDEQNPPAQLASPPLNTTPKEPSVAFSPADSTPIILADTTPVVAVVEKIGRQVVAPSSSFSSNPSTPLSGGGFLGYGLLILLGIAATIHPRRSKKHL